MLRSRTQRLSLATLLLACPLAGTSFAQVDWDGDVFPAFSYNTVQENGPTATSIDNLGPLAIGDTDGSRENVLWQVRNGDLFYTPLPYLNDERNSPGTFSVAFSDVVVLPGASSGGEDLVVAQHMNGLSTVEYISWLGIYSESYLSSSFFYAFAEQLVVAPDDWNTQEGIWARIGNKIYYGEISGGACNPTLMLTLGSTDLYWFSIVDYDDDGSMDMMVATEDGFSVYSQDLGSGNVLLRDVPVTPASGQVVDGGCEPFFTAEGTVNNFTRVLRSAYWYVIEDGSNEYSYLQVISATGTEAVQTFPTGAGGFRPYYMLVADHDNDWDDDLLWMGDQRRALAANNQALRTDFISPVEHFNFQPGKHIFHPLATNPTGFEPPHSVRPVSGNIDNEPGADFAVALGSTSVIQVIVRDGVTGGNGSTPGYSYQTTGVVVDPATNFTFSVPTGASFSSGYEGSPTINLALSLDGGLIDPQSRGFTHVEIQLFHQAGQTSQGDLGFLNDNGTQTTLHELSTFAGNNATLRQWVRAIPRLSSQTTLTGDAWPNGDHIWVKFRFLKYPPGSTGNQGQTVPGRPLDDSRTWFAVYALRTAPPPNVNDLPDDAHISALVNFTEAVAQPITEDNTPIEHSTGLNVAAGWWVPSNTVPVGYALTGPVPIWDLPAQTL